MNLIVKDKRTDNQVEMRLEDGRYFVDKGKGEKEISPSTFKRWYLVIGEALLEKTPETAEPIPEELEPETTPEIITPAPAETGEPAAEQVKETETATTDEPVETAAMHLLKLLLGKYGFEQYALQRKWSVVLKKNNEKFCEIVVQNKSVLIDIDPMETIEEIAELGIKCKRYPDSYAGKLPVQLKIYTEDELKIAVALIKASMPL